MAYHIYSGQVSSGISLSYDEMFIHGGGEADATVADWSYVYVSSGGSANGTTLNVGWMTVSGGGSANNTVINENGELYICDGGVADTVTVTAGGTLLVSSGGTALNVAWTPCAGDVVIYDGAVVTFSSDYQGVYFGANGVLLSSAMTMTGKTLTNHSMYVMNAGTAESTVVGNRGYVYIWNGGVADSTTVNAGGHLLVSAGGKANKTTAISSYIHVSQGGAVNLTDVNSGAYLAVYSGGVATSTTVNESGGMHISNGGVAIFATVNKNGTLSISSGGVASAAVVVDGMLSVLSDGVAISAALSSGGSMSVENGGAATSTTVNSSGSLGVSAGGVVISTTVAGGKLSVSSGGFADRTAVNSFGKLSVSSGGAADNTTVVSGYLYIYNGGSANSIVVNGNGRLFVSNGGVANRTTVNSRGSMYVENGGTANSTTVASYGRLYVSSNAVANSTVVNSRSVLYVNGGTVNSTTVKNGANMHVSGVASVTVLDSGYMYVEKGRAVSTTVNGSGSMYVSSGASATEILENGGFVSAEAGARTTFVANEINGLDIAWGATLHSGTTATLTTVGKNGSMFVFAGGSANETTVHSGGSLSVSSGGVAESVTVSSGGSIFVSKGGAVKSATISEFGTVDIFASGLADTVAVTSYGTLNIRAGAEADNVELHSRGVLNAEAGVVISGFDILSSGSAALAGATLYDVTLGADATLACSDATTVSGATINANAGLYMDGGYISGAAVNDVGALYVSNGGVAHDIALTSNGGVTIIGQASGIVAAGGNIYLGDSSFADYDGTGAPPAVGDIRASSIVLDNAGLDVYFGAVAKTTEVNADSWLQVFYGGKATDTAVTSGGYLTVRNNAAADTVALSSGGFAQLYAGAVLKGNISVGGRITAQHADSPAVEDAIDASAASINFRLDQRTPDDPVIITELGLIRGATYFITIPTEQVVGKYQLGTGAPDFDSTITVKADDETLVGTLSLTAGEEKIIWNNFSYTLTDKEGNLALKVRDLTPVVLSVTADPTAPTNQNVTITADFNESSVTRQYSLNGGADWFDFTTTEEYFDDDDNLVFRSTMEMEYNGTISIRSVDEHEVASEVVEYEVLNIDKIPPEAPVAVADVTEPTNQDVTVTATFSDDSAVREYSLDGETWSEYTEGIVMTANGSIFFRAADAVGNISETEFVVDNIDKEPPVAPTAAANTAAPTNMDVTVTATFSDDSAVREYSFDGETWSEYTEGIVMPENGTVYFRAADALGNVSEVTEYVVDNIDRVPPEAPTAEANTVAPTNQDVTVTATFSEDTMVRMYSLDDLQWNSYTGPVVMADNGSVYFMAADAAGNVSEVVEYVVSNIDKIPPEAPTVVADITELTNQDVTITATYSEDSVGKEYSFDGETWLDYVDGAVATVNGSVYFRGTDEAGNFSDVTEYVVDNIDKIPPELPVAVADITAPTNQNVTVSATFSEDSAVKEYSLDGEAWEEYTDGILMTDNGSVYFRAADALGNTCETVEYVVDNIDRVAPEAPVAVADITAPTNQNVTVTATFSEDSAVVEYSLDGETWNAYTEGIVFGDNGTVYFRGTDEAGNLSEVTEYVVDNIDLIAPEAPVAVADVTDPTNQDVTVTATFSEDSAVREYSLDGEAWLSYTEGIVMPDNGTVYFRGTDEAGNLSEVTEYVVDNIDRVPPEAPTAEANTTVPTWENITVTATFSEDTAVREYSLDGEEWNVYTEGVVMTDNGSVYFRGTDAAGNLSDVTEYVVDNIDKIPPANPVVTVSTAAPTNQDVVVTATFSEDSTVKVYSFDDVQWDYYTEPIVFAENGVVYFMAADAAGNISEVVECVVSNIDKIPPEAPTVVADITDPTNQDVTITATYSEDSAVREYSFDGEAWLDYVDGAVATVNGSVYFRGTDEAGNFSEVTEYVVDNIDKTAPEAPAAVADITGPTNQNVTVTATFSEDTALREYSLDGEAWEEYTEGIVMPDNGSVYFRATDAVGNVSEVTEYVVDNIDLIAPEAPVAVADITAPTNQNVTVSATFSEDSAVVEYSLDGETWSAYTEGIVFGDNGSVYFRGTDAAGNVSEVTEYVVDNIDLIAPEAPVAVADITDPTNQDVTITATYSEDSAVKEYSLDGETWSAYTEGIVMPANGTVYFRGTDEAGNFSDVVEYVVDNIDKTAPELPVAVADITAPTNQNVTVSATFSEDTAVREYSLDGEAWEEYTESIVMTDNGSVYFRATDAVGNVSDTVEFVVGNIDLIAPEAPVAVADITDPTNQNVTVSATFSEDSAVVEYSLDGETWSAYTEGIVFGDNGTVYFRGTDAAGNVSDVTEYVVDNIDLIAPEAPVAVADVTDPTNQDVTVTATFSEDSAVREYSLDGEIWSAYTESIVMTDNGSVYFRGTDAAGNLSDVVEYVVDNIDRVPPEAPTAEASITVPTWENITVTATFSEDTAVREYSFDGEEWNVYTDGVVMADNGSVYFRGTDAAGNVSDVTEFVVDNIDKVPPANPVVTANTTAPTNQDVLVTATFSEDSVGKMYSLDDVEWNYYTGPVVFSDNGVVYFMATDAAGNPSEVVEYVVDNIDLIPPEAPTVVADITELTNQDVTITATYSEDSAVREYSFDGETWLDYIDGAVATVNGTVYFRGTDEAGNFSDVVEYVVDNIDKIPPELPVAVADITVPTTLDVTVSATFSEDSAVREYSLDGEEWFAYTESIVMTDNGSVYFRAADALGNVCDTVEYVVDNIDRVAPEAPVAVADVTAPTNQNVTVSATFSEDSAVVEYSLDGETWSAYTEGIVFGDNGTVYFRGTDAAGNVSEVTEYVVDNIDLIAPEAPVAVADITDPTNQDVTVSATFSEDSAVKEYSLDGEAWIAYADGVVMPANGTVYFRGTDAAGNVSDVVEYVVDNIDKTAPELPVAVADITAPTNQNVTVTATFSEDTAVREYSLDGEAWEEYTEGIVMTDNGSVYFRATDAVGNVSDTVEFVVGNIDLIAPEAPVAVADVTAPTNQNVTVSATFSEDSAVVEYSLDGETWNAYTEGIVFGDNGSVYFRGTDAAGNVSDVTEYVVDNIDLIAPEAPVAAADITDPTNQDVTVTATFSEDSAVREYSLDGEAWIAYADGVVMPDNGSVYFRGTDAAGNVSDVVEYVVDNIDKTAPEAPVAVADVTTLTNQNVTVSATYSEDSAVREYSLDGEAWEAYTDGIVMTVNGSVYFRGTDAAGNLSDVTEYVVDNIDKIPPTKPIAIPSTTAPTNQNVTVSAVFSPDTAVKLYSLDNSWWDYYTEPIELTENGVVYFLAADAAGNISEKTLCIVENIERIPPDRPVATADIMTKTTGCVTVSATFSEDTVTKQYSLNAVAWEEYTEGVVMSENGTVFFRGIDEAGNISLICSYEVSNITDGPVIRKIGDLNSDGRVDIVMSIVQDGHAADGATGAWLIQSDQTAVWGDLSQRNPGWEIFGTGFTDPEKSTADVYIKSSGNVVGAWTTGDDGRVTGWTTVGEFDSATNVLGLGDFNGDGQTDLLLRNDNGAVGCFFTSGDRLGWNYFQSLGDEWQVSAIGDLNGDGRDDVVLKHDAGFAGAWITQNDYTMVWSNLDTLSADYSIVGTGDFDGDGTDDVLLQKGTYFGAWQVRNGGVNSWFGIGDLGDVTVEQIGDFDNDGIDDLRIRTAAGDLGALLVKGADTVEWKYYGSVGSEWRTSLASI